MYSIAADEWNRIHCHGRSRSAVQCAYSIRVQAVSISGGLSENDHENEIRGLFYRLGIRSRPIVRCRAQANHAHEPSGALPDDALHRQRRWLRRTSAVPSSGFDYNASFSPDGKWIVFTSERNGSGQADLYRVRVDGSGLERLTDDPALDDQAAFSPDGNQIAFVSTRGAHTANIWILDLKTRKLRNLTGGPALQASARQARRLFPAVLVAGRAMDRVFIGPQFRFQAARISAAGMGASTGIEHLHHPSGWPGFAQVDDEGGRFNRIAQMVAR